MPNTARKLRHADSDIVLVLGSGSGLGLRAPRARACSAAVLGPGLFTCLLTYLLAVQECPPDARSTRERLWRQVSVYIDIHTHAHIHAHVHAYMHACIYIHIYMHACIHSQLARKAATQHPWTHAAPLLLLSPLSTLTHEHPELSLDPLAPTLALTLALLSSDSSDEPSIQSSQGVET